MKVLVTILAYNEEAIIADVIRRVQFSLPAAMVVVINDGSRDGTSDAARRAGAEVIDLPYNLGIGGAMQTGLKVGIQGNYDVIVRMDGDGQHPPEEIYKLLPYVASGAYDIAVGTRFLNQKLHKDVVITRRMGIFIFSKLATWFSGRQVTDATCSFQVINRRAAIFLDKNMEQDHPEVDGWILLGRAGYRVKEVDVEIQPRRLGVSSIDTWRALYFVVKVSLTAFVARSRRYIV